MEKSIGDTVNAEIMNKIEILNPDEKKKFDRFLMDNLYDRYWCRENGIDYVNPNVGIAKGKTYNEIVRCGLVRGERQS